jgi:hypothetical protein
VQKNQPWGLARGLAFELSMLFFSLSFVSAYLLLQSALPSVFSLSLASVCTSFSLQPFSCFCYFFLQFFQRGRIMWVGKRDQNHKSQSTNVIKITKIERDFFIKQRTGIPPVLFFVQVCFPTKSYK